MTRARSKKFRIFRAAGWTVAVLAALYLVAGNLLVKTRLLREATNLKPEDLVLEYDSAYTLFPGHVRVKGLAIRVQDRNIRFALTAEDATVRVALHELAQQRFHATRVRATGLSVRALHKVKQLEGAQARVAAFPPIEGFDGPPVSQPPPEGPAPGMVEGVWTIHLDDVEATVRELWLLEYRYVGEGHVAGAFELKPMKSLWVGPARLELKEGALTAGPAVISSNFGMEAECTITPLDIPSALGVKLVRSISASVKLAALIEDVGAAELYQPGLEAKGGGTLTADLRVTQGRFTQGSALDAHLEGLKLRMDGAGFDGTVRVGLKLAPDEKGIDVPVGHAAVAGLVRLPIPGGSPLLAVLAGAGADLSLTTADVVEGPALDWLHGRLREARAEDAGALTEAAAQKAPVLAPAVLGQGPLVFGGTADVTKGKVVIELSHAKLGGAELTGTAVKTGEAWDGAAAGRVAGVAIGLLLKDGALQVLPFIRTGWLAGQREALGFESQTPVR